VNEVDKQFWEDLFELTAKKEWETFLEYLNEMQDSLENQLLNAESWEKYLETRGRYKGNNVVLNLRDLAREQLENAEKNEEDI
jgi:hypothetical protein